MKRNKRQNKHKISITKILLIGACVGVLAIIAKNSNVVTNLTKGKNNTSALQGNAIIYISDESDFRDFMSDVEDGTSKYKTAVLTNDIVLTSNINPIEDFYGTFDGAGHTISGLVINKSNQDYVALFNNNEDRTVTIKNLGLISPQITGKNNVGGIITGQYERGTIDSCYINGGSISGEKYVGGIAGGYSQMEIYKTYNSATVTGTGDYVGGIVGYGDEGIVKYCYNRGDITGANRVGGIAGIPTSAALQYCYNVGVVSSSIQNGEYIGSVVGFDNGADYNNIYYRSTLSTTDPCAVSKTEEQMKSTDFITLIGGSDYWSFVDNIDYDYPVLRWQAAEIKTYVDIYSNYGFKYNICKVERNGNETITASDSAAIEQIINGAGNGILNYNIMAADADGNNAINEIDADYVLSKVLLDTKKVPAQYKDSIQIRQEETLNILLERNNIADTGINITWQSTNPNIATVDSNGTITGIKEGECDVIVKVENNWISETKILPVNVIGKHHLYTENEKIKVDGRELLLGDANQDKVLDYKDINYILADHNMTNSDVNGDGETNTIDADLIQRKLNGELNIFPALWKTEEKMYEGDTLQVYVDGAERINEWESSNETIATISTNGLVTGLKPGRTTITAFLDNDEEIQMTIVVQKDLKLETSIEQSIVSGTSYYSENEIDIDITATKGTKNITDLYVETISANVIENERMQIDYTGGNQINTTIALFKGNNSISTYHFVKDNPYTGDTCNAKIELKAYGTFQFKITATDEDGRVKESEIITIRNVNDAEEQEALGEPFFISTTAPALAEGDRSTYNTNTISIEYGVNANSTADFIGISIYDKKTGNNIYFSDDDITPGEFSRFPLTLRNKPDGEYSVEITISSNNGATSYTLIQNLVIDTTKPEVPTLTIVSGTYNSVTGYYTTPIAVKVEAGADTGSGYKKLKVMTPSTYYDGTSQSDEPEYVDEDDHATYTFNSKLKKGTVTATTIDNAGNESEEATTGEFKVDYDKPEIRDISFSGQGISVTAYDNNKIGGYAVTRTNQAPAWSSTIWKSTEEWTSSQNGEETGVIEEELSNGTYYIWIKDIAGHISEAEEIQINNPNSIGITAVTVDEQNMETPYDGEWTKENVKITLSSDDASITKYQYQPQDSSSWIDIENPFTITRDCNATIKFRGWRNSSSQTSEVSKTIKIDRLSPDNFSRTTNKTPANGWYNEPITVTGTAQDHESGIGNVKIELYKDNEKVGENSANSETASINIEESGIYLVKIIATDKVGNSDDESEVGGAIRVDLTDFSNTDNIRIEGVPSDWTKDPVTISVIFPSISGIKNVSVKKNGQGDSLVTSSETPTENKEIQFTANSSGNYILTAESIFGDQITKTITIDKIDTTKPTIISASENASGQIVIAASDDKSGIAGYAITSTNTEPTADEWLSNDSSSYTSNKKDNGTYYVWAKDRAGNISLSTQLVITSGSESQYFRVKTPYQISGQFITRVLPDTKYSEFKEKLETNMTYTITGKNNDDLVKTGDSLEVTNSAGTKTTYKLVVIGDVNSDGKSDILDLNQLRKRVISLITLNEEQEKAADMNLNDDVDITDLLTMRQYVIEIISRDNLIK